MVDNFGHASRLESTVCLRPLIPTFPPRIPVQPENEPHIIELQAQFQRDWEDEEE